MSVLRYMGRSRLHGGTNKIEQPHCLKSYFSLRELQRELILLDCVRRYCG